MNVIIACANNLQDAQELTHETIYKIHQRRVGHRDAAILERNFANSQCNREFCIVSRQVFHHKYSTFEETPGEHFFKDFFFPFFKTFYSFFSILLDLRFDFSQEVYFSRLHAKRKILGTAGSLVTVRWRLITIRAPRWLISETMNVRNVARWTPWHDFNLIPWMHASETRKIIMIMRVHARTRGEWLDQWETRKLEILKDVSSRVKSHV